MVDPELIAIMSDVVTLTPVLSRGLHSNERAYDDENAITPRCHIQYDQSYANVDPAHSYPIGGMVLLDDVYPVRMDWKVTLPAGGPMEGKTVFIIGIEQTNDENGPYNTNLTLGAR